MKNKIKKIIYFIQSPFNKRDYDRFGIEVVQQNGFEVEVWDFGSFLHPHIHQKVKTGVPDPSDWRGVKYFTSEKEALGAIFKLGSETFVIPIIIFNLNSFKIYRMISKKRLKYGVIVSNNQLSPDNGSTVNFLSKIRKLTLKRLPSILFNRTQFNYLSIQPASFLLAGGEQSTRGHRYPVNKTTKIIWSHTLDYDIYLRTKNRQVKADNNMGVFLDEDVPFHSDYLYMGVQPPATPEEYYPLLCNFFTLLENKYNVRIVIAAHPRSRYDNLTDYFQGRPVIRGETVELIKKAGFAITHSSTSVNYPILFEKPIIFITTNRLQQSQQGPLIGLIASKLAKIPINLNNFSKIDWIKEMTFDRKAYLNFKHQYIKKDGSEELPCWQIFANHIKSLDDV